MIMSVTYFFNQFKISLLMISTSSIRFNREYGLVFLLRPQNDSKFIVLLHLTHSSDRCQVSCIKYLILLRLNLYLMILMENRA